MTEWPTERIAGLDKQYVWHPFTPMAAWCAPDHEPLVLVEGEGAILRDSRGREYLDGNSSIWTNVHGHAHPVINRALHAQLDRVAHTSFLGFTNPPAAELAAELVRLFPAGSLSRVFFSDDGSTAMEAAVKMIVQYWQLLREPRRQRFVAFTGAYHGDSMGASSLGGLAAFHDRFSGYQFPVDHVSDVEQLPARGDDVAAVVIEPLIQGAAGMRLWPRGMLRRLRRWCDEQGALLVADEVMTGFGRTGNMFACQQEDVVPDFLALGKGLSGGYLPLAATITTEKIFATFLNSGEEDRTFYYGHSYSGNQLGCAAALASLGLFRDEQVLKGLGQKIASMQRLLEVTTELPNVAEVRQCGFIAGIELRRDDGKPFDTSLKIGAAVCRAAPRHGLLTRPINDTLVLMPPYCISEAQLTHAVQALTSAITEVVDGS